jgi:hypothetical protein
MWDEYLEQIAFPEELILSIQRSSVIYSSPSWKLPAWYHKIDQGRYTPHTYIHTPWPLVRKRTIPTEGPVTHHIHTHSVAFSPQANYTDCATRYTSHSFQIKIKLHVRFEVFHGGDYEEWCLLGCYAVWLLREPTFRRNLAPPSSG